MPFYEYECASCKFYSEVMQKITDAPLRKCPSCGKNALKKLVSAPVFRLKGSGWYETDFKSDGEKKRNLVGEDKAPADKADAKSDAKTPPKADAKADKDAGSKETPKAAEPKPAPTKASSASRKSARRGAPPKRPAAAKAKRRAGR